MGKMNSVIEEYMGMVFKVVILVITGACMCAGVTFSLLKILGFYPTVSWIGLGIFVLTCVLYFTIGCFLIKNAFIIDAATGKKMIRPETLRNGKLFMTVILIIQFNFISYLIPSRDFWAFAFFFVILMAFFMDVKVVSVLSGGIAVSVLISGVVKAQIVLPVMDAYFIPELVLRIICVVLSLASIILITFLTSHYLVNVKKDEMETNNARVQNVITKATYLSEGLMNASASLSEISQNESASAQELTATSESLLANSNELISKAQESMSN
ncbi:MAG: hypothetical protein K2K54_11535, partial [Lachnospiraceae bacterium]|nr:hypothetical protein [Lachnospiraceae bacterium]